MSDPENQQVPEGTVTVLFTDLVESTRLNQSLGDEAAREIGRQVEDMARTVVVANRGVLIKEMGDGLMAAFASARRAVTAAREVQVEMGRLHRAGLDDAVEMRIGLHTGEVIGEEGDIHGETVIIAKRIEGLAPAGGILASDTVHGVLGTARDELVSQGSAELKGIDAEWELYLVPVPDDDEEDALLAANAPTPYVGRVAEREQLRAMLEAAAAGHGSMVLIGGPAGMGKSRLTREAAAMAERLGMSVLTGHCVDMESPPPYQPSIDHLEQAARVASPEGFRTALGINAPEVAKLLPSLRQRYDDIPPSPELTPEQERRYMLHGVGEFTERAAGTQPLLLTFEDLHWADESTMLFLRHMAPRLTHVPLMMLGTYRDDELAPERPLTTSIGPLIRDGGAVDLHPQLLTIDEVRSVLTARAGQEAPPELVDLVFDETQGNPFFVEELFRHLSESGRIFDEEGRWRAGFEIGETEVPQGIRLLISRRLEQLDPEHRKVLASAAVIGRTFAFGHLASVVGSDEDDLFDALEAAERANLIEDLPAEDDAHYLFVHEQIRQTLVGELALARRQRVHLRIADALVASGHDSSVDLAHHLLSAGTAAPRARTVEALIAAARANIDSLAFEDALPHIDHAAKIVDDDDDDRLDLRRMQADALRGAGRVDDALDVLDEELERTEDRDVQIALRLQRVQLVNDQYRAGEGLADIDALVAAADERDDPELDVAVQLARGRAHYILSLDDPAHAHQSRDAYEAAYQAAKQQGDKASMARALLPTTWFTDYWADYHETAKANADEAMRLAREIGDEDLLLDAEAAWMHRGGVGFNAEVSEELLARLEQRRDPVKLNAHCFWMMWQYTGLGRFADSVAMCDRGIELAELIGSAPVQYGGIKAIALTEMGRFDEVAAAIGQEVTDDEHPFGQAMASLARSVLLSRLGAWGPAATSLTDTMARAEALSRVWMQHWAGSLMAVVAANLRAGDWASAPVAPTLELDLEEFRTKYAAGGLPAGEVALVEGRPADAASFASRAAETDGTRDQVSALDLMARAHLDLGDRDAAGAAADRGLKAAESMDFGSLTWRIRMVRARALGESTDEAAVEFRELANRISDPELRWWFERQPFAPR
ncbi:MAG TPA: AAA family ATPase [Acidimicrobiales bacterium]|nr:AAA family ATPase [Acidimicrobiales bacterium]